MRAILGGVRSRGVSFCVEDERHEMKLESGEVAMLDDKGNLVHFTKNGIRILSDNAVEVIAKQKVTSQYRWQSMPKKTSK